MTLLMAFAGLALLLAATGVYGVMAYAVSQRTQEIGVRMALGARASEVVLMVVRQGLDLALVGLALGLGAAAAGNRVVATLLFEVKPTDPATYATVAIGVMAVAAFACYLPARRAASIDPVRALRC
jgi:ABC-type antimicrobial peptide transport system permease subunit